MAKGTPYKVFIAGERIEERQAVYVGWDGKLYVCRVDKPKKENIKPVIETTDLDDHFWF